METIVDQLKTVNSKSFLNEIKNPSNITILILKNFNNETNWDEISNQISLGAIDGILDLVRVYKNAKR